MFSAVRGQDAAVTAVRALLARTGGSGSTMLVGPDGVGRFLLAHTAARAILGDAALVDAGRHPDYLALEPAAGIAGVRDAIAALQRKAAMGPRQVLILRDADRMSVDAHNALLKTLEEPPGDAALFVIAEEPTLLPETVVSRCRLVRLKPLGEDDVAAVLADHGAPAELARDAGGSPGRALFHHAHGVAPAADKLADALRRPRPDALADAESIVRKRKDEDGRAQRRRLTEVLRVVATRLGRELPETENVLRSVVEALGSLGANANPGIVFAELVLDPWRRTKPR